MVMLKSLPENYFRNNKNFKTVTINNSNNEKIGNIYVNHFKGSIGPYKIYTYIKGEIIIKNDENNKLRYEFSVDYDENMSLEDFTIEYDKIVRKWEKLAEYIVQEIEVL